MSGNATEVEIVSGPILAACGDHACDVCGGHLPDHDWADLDNQDPPRIVDCSEQAR